MFNVSFAENLKDLFESKKGSLDFHYKCVDDVDAQFVDEFGIKKIGSNKFLFEYSTEDKVYWDSKAVIEYKRKVQGIDAEVFFYYSLINPDYEAKLMPGIKVNIIMSAKNKTIMHQWWIKNDENSTRELDDEFYDIVENFSGKKLEDNLIQWTEKIHNIISKRLDFGEPFEFVDLETPPLDKFIKNPYGYPYVFTSTCKIKK